MGVVAHDAVAEDPDAVTPLVVGYQAQELLLGLGALQGEGMVVAAPGAVAVAALRSQGLPRQSAHVPPPSKPRARPFCWKSLPALGLRRSAPRAPRPRDGLEGEITRHAKSERETRRVSSAEASPVNRRA